MAKFIRYRTGDTCPGCGQPIKLTGRADLYAFSVVCCVLGLNDLGRTEKTIRGAEARRKTLSCRRKWYE